jgi:hypothetical protein
MNPSDPDQAIRRQSLSRLIDKLRADFAEVPERALRELIDSSVEQIRVKRYRQGSVDDSRQ